MEGRGFAIFMALLFASLGLVMVFNPRAMWGATEAWKFRNSRSAEPSDTYLALRQLSGVLVIVLSIVIFGLAVTRKPPKPELEQSPLNYLTNIPDNAAVGPDTIVPGEPDRVVVGNLEVPNSDDVEQTFFLSLTVTDSDGDTAGWRNLLIAVPANSTREFSPTVALDLADLPDGEYRWEISEVKFSAGPITSGTFTIGPPPR